MKSFYGQGKLLLTAEYVVLDGAKALAVPSNYGQSLQIEKGEIGKLKWTSFDELQNVWFESEFGLQNNEILKQDKNDDPVSNRLLQILNTAKQLNSTFLADLDGYTITTKLSFPKNWGLGTSSTLISNVASWAKINPYQLLEATFGGSGYDIACARALKSLTFQLKGNEQIINTVDFSPVFKDHIYFVHLNQKQNSRDGIKQYRLNTSDLSSTISEINNITDCMIECESLIDFQKLMDQHELLISEVIKQKPVKKMLFSDFKGSIKSLGAWGGDFVMIASEDDPTTYFKSKGYHTILTFSKMVKN
ncbi:GYDIA family GHMP kinase [Psychroserpens sp. Hel_I_66]|uniref:GYDIA family GHMP kinase n=1 Tax=Psychroserpens sp. Hel_I_66 TaxID=1250004 RepID=UPI000646E86A|nr:GYDIA family GHMP kinase [Psychroserpens sp. Hel_I_66]